MARGALFRRLEWGFTVLFTLEYLMRLAAVRHPLAWARRGIFTSELLAARRGKVSTQACPECGLDGHDSDARHCKFCGARL